MMGEGGAGINRTNVFIRNSLDLLDRDYVLEPRIRF
jgi:hypothetical protein